MGLFDKLRHELVDIVEWTDDSKDTIVWRFPRYDNEIKNGAQLIVRESQVAAFINQGKLADVFTPGQYSLATANLPILSTLQGWKYGFNSPFKAEVYFVSTRTITDRKWGTKNPIMMRDPEFGMVRLRAFGSFAIKVKDAPAFLRQVAGTEARFTVDEIEEQLRDLLVARFADALGTNKIAALDLAGNYDRVGRLVAASIQPDFDGFGLQIVNLVVENISLPPEVEAAMDKRTSMGVIGNMQTYTQFETANAIHDAANNPGGIAGAGAGLAAGYQMASQMGQAFNNQSSATAQAGPPPVPGAAAFFAAIGGAQVGPLSMNDLSARLHAGDLTPQTLVWKQGMSGWVAAQTVPELGALFAAVPPPLPKS
ncbi:MAG: SPFH domain-containing protein [Planctomycetota bacterium]|nr:SPFH domain-containing protein [Planctomycetota bacterium]